nr:MAG TPA: hypothetical protein [Caudoviricetes sp.]
MVILYLETLGLGGERTDSQSSYINKQNKEQPCFSLNRDGMLQMLNSVDEDEKVVNNVYALQGFI